MTNRRIWLRRALIAGSLCFGAQQLWRHGHAYVFAMQFVTVEPGKIYRGAWQKPRPMRRIIQDYKIKTILALAHPPEHSLSVQERDLARELGVRWVHIPIVDQRTTDDREAENAISDLLEEAAAVVADPDSYPIFFHCHHGLNRTSMVQIAYRTKYCGWTLEQAVHEIDRTVGLVKVAHGPDYRHMVSFYQNRVLPLRQQQSGADTRTSGDLTAGIATPITSSVRR
jgi:protein-tyrosine phosphatase